MSDNNFSRVPEDEIDLLELLETLWQGKWQIVGFMTAALALVAVYAYSQFQKPASYTVTIPYSVNLFIPEAYRHCLPENLLCHQKMTVDELVTLAGGEWSLDDDAHLILVTDSPLAATAYDAEISSYNQALTDDILTRSEEEIRIIDELAPYASILQTEELARVLLGTKRTMLAISNGKKALSLSQSSVTQNNIRSFNSLFFGAVFSGGILGCIFVLIRQAFHARGRTSA